MGRARSRCASTVWTSSPVSTGSTSGSTSAPGTTSTTTTGRPIRSRSGRPAQAGPSGLRAAGVPDEHERGGHMLAYKLKVRFFKNFRLNAAWRRGGAAPGVDIGDYKRLPDYVRRFAPGKSFIDVGCMWGVNGEYSFVAEEAGAARVTAVDVFGPTPEFEQERAERSSSVEFVLGDATRAESVERIGRAEVVLCAGVLYHHPSPFDLLVALRRICTETLILRTATIPEIDGLPHAAVYLPMLAAGAREVWNLKPLGLLHQAGISTEFQPSEGYGNWFWGLTPSCLESLLKTAGFRVEFRATEAFAHTVVCAAVAPALEHRLPDPASARTLAAEISAAGIARPA